MLFWLPGDPQKRRTYDKYGDASLASDFHGEPEREIPKNRPTQHELSVSLEELYKGTSKTLRVRRSVFINNSTNAPCETDGSDVSVVQGFDLWLVQFIVDTRLTALGNLYGM